MSHKRKNPLPQDLIDKDPFLYLKIDDVSILNKISNRSTCSKCNKSRKYFCYTCYIPVEELNGQLPKVKLPIRIDIIKHKNEIDGKSTAIHAAILAFDDVHIYTYPEIPDYSDMKNEIVLIFPSRQALTVEELFYKHANNVKTEEIFDERIQILETRTGYNPGTLLKNQIKSKNAQSVANLIEALPIKRAVFIDSTWNQSKGIFKDPRVNQLQCVVLQNRISQFWRHQRNSPRWYLSTIEAIHQFVLEIHINAWGFNVSYEGLNYLFHDFENISNKSKDDSDKNAYNGQYDNLLYFFKYMHEKIHAYYSHEQLQAYKRPIL